jgi:hypothetical protein
MLSSQQCGCGYVSKGCRCHFPTISSRSIL